MSFHEKIAWSTLGSMLIVYGFYFYTVLSAAADTPVDEIAYQGLMVFMIVVFVVMVVVAAVVAAVVDPREADVTDERDRSIDRRGSSVGGAVLGAGILVPLVLAMVDAETFWIAQAILAALVLGQVAEEVTKVVAYRRGL